MTRTKPTRKKSKAQARQPLRSRRGVGKKSVARKLRSASKVIARKSPVKKTALRKRVAAVTRRKPAVRKRAVISRKKTTAKTKVARVKKPVVSKSKAVHRIRKPPGSRISKPVSIARILSDLAGKRAPIARPAKSPVVAMPRPVVVLKSPESISPATKLPESYGTRELHLVARDPRWLYAQWDFTREQMREFAELTDAGRLSLRIYEDSPAGLLVKQVELELDSRFQFVPVAAGVVQYVAELGYETPRGSWVTVALSNPVIAPPATIAIEETAIFATIPVNISFAQIMESLGPAYAGATPLVDAIRRFQASRKADITEEQIPAGVFIGATECHWTVEQTRLLAHVMGATSIRRQMEGDLSSLIAAQILPGRQFEIPDLTALLEVEDGQDSYTSPGGGWSGDLICVEE